MSGSANPVVSLGLPVRNGERFLPAAIESLLAQTFEDLEVVIVDNASTDRTEEIARDYASRDRRVRYSRNPRNIGGSNNHNLAFRRSRGRYFRWASHDDVALPRLVESCVAVLDQDPGVVLAYPRSGLISAVGAPVGEVARPRGGAARASDRFRDLMSWDHDCEASYGLIRREALARTRLERNYTDSDRTLLCEVALRGRFHFIDDVLFLKRIHDDMSVRQFPDWRQRMAWFRGDGDRPGIDLPHWQQFAHFAEIVAAGPMSPGDRVRCAGHLVRWLGMERRWGRLANDVVQACRRGPVAGSAS